jgi:hypothetical protein
MYFKFDLNVIILSVIMLVDLNLSISVQIIIMLIADMLGIFILLQLC